VFRVVDGRAARIVTAAPTSEFQVRPTLWPGLFRPSTSSDSIIVKVVDARDERGHDVHVGSSLRLPFRGILRRGLGFLSGEDLFGNESGILADCDFDLAGNIGIGLKERLGILAALADALTVV